MKIGIFTFQRSHNYGAVLQAYALKTTLESMGHEVKMVDYWPKSRHGAYKRFDFSFLRSFKMSLKERVQRIVIHPQRFVRYKRFEDFIHTYLNLPERPQYVKPEHIQDDCELYIYGSDQIWRYNNFQKLNGFDEVYWGKFPVTPNRKITYAASMGVLRAGNAELEFIQQHLHHFQALAVREIQLQEIIQPLTEKSVVHVLDPVFLVPAEKWKLITPEETKIKRKYILFYHLVYAGEAVAVVSDLKKKTGLDVIEINGLPFNKTARGIDNGPLEFLNLIQHAAYVVSTSFHGVVFSIVFKKQFYSLGMGNNSTRVKSVLDALGIKDRLIPGGHSVDVESKIDYDAVDPKLNSLRQKSIEYLLNNIL